jgi:hypothetical protein
MRLLWLFMIVTLAAGAGMAFLWARQSEQRHEAAVVATIDALDRINREIRVRAAMGSVEVNGRGWPYTVDPAWFNDDPPLNRLVGGSRPWLEVAASTESEEDHPRVRTTIDGSTPAFWYNPGKGIVRARVGLMLADESALELYNRVNKARLRELIAPLPADDLPPPLTADAGE